MAGKYRRLGLAALLAVFLMGVGMNGLPVMASEVDEPGESGETTQYHTGSGKCGANIDWTLEEGVLTLTGSGAMNDYLGEKEDPFLGGFVPVSIAPWKDYAEEINKLVLDNRITKIGEGAFWGIQARGRLELPDGLTGIGDYAFKGCGRFDMEIKLPETLKSIGDFAFDQFANTTYWETNNNHSSEPDWKIKNDLYFYKNLGSIGVCSFQGYWGVDKVFVENSKMTFGMDCIEGTSDVDGKMLTAMYGVSGSTAQTYAQSHNWEFREWAPGKTHYTVTFDTGGGTAVFAQQVEIGECAQEPEEVPEKAGFYFMGWYLDDVRFDFSKPLSSDITLTARWSDVHPSEVKPELAIDNSDRYKIVLKWDKRSGCGLQGYEIYRAAGADGEYTLLATVTNPTADSYEDPTGYTYEKSQYRYKIRAIYTIDGSTQDTPDSDEVSAKGMIAGNPEELDQNCIGLRITDAEGNPVESLTLHVGESSPELHLQYQYQNGTAKDWREVCAGKGGWLNWSINEDVRLGPEDWTYAKILPTFDYLGLDSSAKGASAQLRGVKEMPGGTVRYVSVVIQGMGDGQISIPLTVIPAEEGADYGEENGIAACESMEEAYQALRDGFRARDSHPFALITSEAYRAFEEEYSDGDAPDAFMDNVFDFYADRADMRADDGDYLMEGITDYLYAQEDIHYGVDNSAENFYNYKAVYFKNVGYATTRDQENWMNAQIEKLFNQPGGRFYDYKRGTHSDYEKIKAVYDYVSSELGIKWVDGTYVTLYHMAYSALHDRRGTCQSYALLFYRFTRELGISSRVLMGVDASAHTYNIVQLDGKYYYVDCSNKRFLQGSKSFRASPLQQQWRTKRFQENYIGKISEENYGGSQSSSIKSITALSDEQIKALDANLISTADRMAAAYKIKGSGVTVSNVSKKVFDQVYGCSEYLGMADETEANKNRAKQEWGYYLAFRVNVDAAKFASAADNRGSLKISYDLAGNDGSVRRVMKEYTTADSSTLKDGYVDVLLKLDYSEPAISIAVDFDKEGQGSAYQITTYNFDLSSLKKQDSDEFGTVKEISDTKLSHGIETSSPRVQSRESGRKMTVTYDSVAKSMNVEEKELHIQSEEGYYIALQVNAPEAMKGTASLQKAVTVELAPKTNAGKEGTGGTAQILDYETAEDHSYVRLFMPVSEHMSETVNVTWAGEQTQAVVIETAEGCVFETVNERAVLPKSVKFNGLQKTMYVGQTQTADTAITRKYEQDEVRLVFTSSDSSVVGINRITGVMDAFRPGTATITVTMTDGTGKAPVDNKGNIVKGMTASAKITVKAPTAPGSIKLTEIKDTSATVNWKANTTGQWMEIYAIPLNKAVMGKSKNNWKAAIETALAEEDMGRRLLQDMASEEVAELRQNLQNRFSAEGCVLLGGARADEKLAKISGGLEQETSYVFYLRNAVKNQVGEIYYTGAVSGETKTKKKVLGSVVLKAQTSDGTAVSGTYDEERRQEVFAITADSLEQGPQKLVYTVLDENGAEDKENPLTYTKPAYKSTNTKVVKVNSKGVLSLGGQAGVAELYVTGKDSAGTVRESQRICVRVVKEPNNLSNKSTTLALGARIELRDLIGYNTKGSTGELKLEKVDFAGLLKQIEETGSFKIIQASDANPAKATIVAADFLTDAVKGMKKAGNSVKLEAKLYKNAGDSSGEPVSTAVVTIKVADMAKPSISKVTPKDTYVQVKFKAAANVPVVLSDSEAQQYEKNSERYYYTVEVTDKATGQQLTIPEGNSELTMLEEDKNAKTPLYTYIVRGLTEEHNYSVQVTAHYDVTAGTAQTIAEQASGGTSQKASRASGAKNFKTLKLLLGSGGAQTDEGTGTTQIRYISLPQLRSTPTAEGDLITHREDAEEEIVLRNNETYVFMAQVSKLNRVLGTDKLKWTVSSGTKGIATVKATGDTYQAQLTTQRTGTFTVTVTSTVSKETLAVFRVKVVPYQTQSQNPGGAGSDTETQNPGETGDGTETQNPGETGGGTETQNPGETGGGTETQNPGETGGETETQGGLQSRVNELDIFAAEYSRQYAAEQGTGIEGRRAS